MNPQLAVIVFSLSFRHQKFYWHFIPQEFRLPSPSEFSGNFHTLLYHVIFLDTLVIGTIVAKRWHGSVARALAVEESYRVTEAVACQQVFIPGVRCGSINDFRGMAAQPRACLEPRVSLPATLPPPFGFFRFPFFQLHFADAGARSYPIQIYHKKLGATQLSHDGMYAVDL